MLWAKGWRLKMFYLFHEQDLINERARGKAISSGPSNWGGPDSVEIALVDKRKIIVKDLFGPNLN